jgi:hypothetical protein
MTDPGTQSRKEKFVFELGALGVLARGDRVSRIDGHRKFRS